MYIWSGLLQFSCLYEFTYSIIYFYFFRNNATSCGMTLGGRFRDNCPCLLINSFFLVALFLISLLSLVGFPILHKKDCMCEVSSFCVLNFSVLSFRCTEMCVFDNFFFFLSFIFLKVLHNYVSIIQVKFSTRFEMYWSPCIWQLFFSSFHLYFEKNYTVTFLWYR